MNIPPEFVDYLTTKDVLTTEDKAERFDRMHKDEIAYRANIFKNLKYDKETAIARIQGNMEWAFELGNVPEVYKSITSIVNNIYKQL